MNIIKKPHFIELNSIGSSELGYITVAEYQDNFPFEIKRVYWTYYTPNQVTRGHHAHKSLEQCIFAVSGQIEFELINTEGKTYNFLLDTPDKGLHIPPMHWRKIKFSHSAVLLCLASERYNESDYIRSFEVFAQNYINFDKFDRKALDLTWLWLNDSEIKYLTNTPDFTKKSQLKWFNSLSTNKAYFIKSIKYNNKNIGVVGLKNITKNDAEYWGYIGEKSYWGLGVGKIMLGYMLKKAISLGINQVYLLVIKDNLRAISLYKKKGFQIVSESDKEYRMVKKLND